MLIDGRRSFADMACRAAGTIALSAVLALPFGAALAQTEPPQPAAAMPAASAPMGMMHTAQMPERFADDVEIRIALLHHELDIQPAQEALFRAYADVLRANAQATTALFVARISATDFSAPARLRWYAQLNAAHAQAIQNMIGPFDALYQSLSPQQKAAADRHFAELRQRRMPMRGQ